MYHDLGCTAVPSPSIAIHPVMMLKSCSCDSCDSFCQVEVRRSSVPIPRTPNAVIQAAISLKNKQNACKSRFAAKYMLQRQSSCALLTLFAPFPSGIMAIQILSDIHLDAPKAYDIFEITPKAAYLAFLGDIGNVVSHQDGYLAFLCDQLRVF